MQTDLSASTSEKKSIQKLQRAIVDGLEEVKAQDIQVFDTEHLSALFERVIVASGTSNRQTRALAASVRDAVRAAEELIAREITRRLSSCSSTRRAPVPTTCSRSSRTRSTIRPRSS